MNVNSDSFPPNMFARIDETDDEHFYGFPRLVVHIDDQAIATLRSAFADVLPSSGTYLDLMSSWRSHLPPDLKPAWVVGLGMNAAEMADNPQLDEHLVQNLNRNPQLPFDDSAFDATICTVSVQYMTQPLEIFAEVYRVLKPGGVFVVSFSNRCFQQKAVAAWLSTGDTDHIALVSSYFQQSANWRNLKTRIQPSVRQGNGFTDPLYVVWAVR